VTERIALQDNRYIVAPYSRLQFHYRFIHADFGNLHGASNLVSQPHRRFEALIHVQENRLWALQLLSGVSTKSMELIASG
jgi:hypothetical protein